MGRGSQRLHERTGVGDGPDLERVDAVGVEVLPQELVLLAPVVPPSVHRLHDAEVARIVRSMEADECKPVDSGQGPRVGAGEVRVRWD